MSWTLLHEVRKQCGWYHLISKPSKKCDRIFSPHLGVISAMGDPHALQLPRLVGQYSTRYRLGMPASPSWP